MIQTFYFPGKAKEKRVSYNKKRKVYLKKENLRLGFGFRNMTAGLKSVKTCVKQERISQKELQIYQDDAGVDVRPTSFPGLLAFLMLKKARSPGNEVGYSAREYNNWIIQRGVEHGSFMSFVFKWLCWYEF